MSFEIEGKLHKVFETESKTASFQAREFVIVISEDNYPQYVKFQLTQDKCSAIDGFEPGSQVKVHFDLRGREWNEKYFTNLNAWRIEGVKTEVKTEAPVDQATEFPPYAADFGESISSENQDFDDLPF